MKLSKLQAQLAFAGVLLVAVLVLYWFYGDKLRTKAAGVGYTVSQWWRDLAGWLEKPVLEKQYGKERARMGGSISDEGDYWASIAPAPDFFPGDFVNYHDYSGLVDFGYVS